MNSDCWARVGDLAFGPFPLGEFAQLINDKCFPSDLEFRLDATELWWSLSMITADASTSSSNGDLDCLGDWFVRTGDNVAGPYSVVDVTTEMLAGRLSPDIEIQIGSGTWRPVAQLLVLIPATEHPDFEPTPPTTEPVPATEQTEPLSPEEIQKAKLEAWFSQTLPDRKITFTVVPRTPSGTLDEIIAAAMLRVSAEAEEVAKELSRPWIWGGLAVVALVTTLMLWWPHGDPDELEVTAYHRLMTVSETIRAVRATQPSEEDWQAFADELNEELKPLKEELSIKKRSDAPIKELLFWAVEYRLPRILQEGRLKPSPAETHFAENLRQAKKYLGTAGR